MSGYNISITGNSNDSDLVLASSGGSIAENGSSNLVPLTGRFSNLETSMNSVQLRTTDTETKTTILETSMNSVEAISEFQKAVSRGDIIYMNDVFAWSSVHVSNYITAKLIQEKYIEKQIVPFYNPVDDNGNKYFSYTNIHILMGTGSQYVPAFDAETWDLDPLFYKTRPDISNGRTLNKFATDNDALQITGWFIPDIVLDASLVGMPELKALITNSNYISNWTVPPSGLVDAINNVISNNPSFGTFYSNPLSWHYTGLDGDMTQEFFDDLSINVTVSHPNEGSDFGVTNYSMTVYTKIINDLSNGATPNNLFWGYAWSPWWTGAYGTTYIKTRNPSSSKVRKIKSPRFEHLFPHATALFDAINFTNADIAAFSTMCDLQGMSITEAGDKWLLDNSGGRPDTWLAATNIVTPGRIQTLENQIADLLSRIAVLES